MSHQPRPRFFIYNHCSLRLELCGDMLSGQLACAWAHEFEVDCANSALFSASTIIISSTMSHLAEDLLPTVEARAIPVWQHTSSQLLGAVAQPLGTARALPSHTRLLFQMHHTTKDASHNKRCITQQKMHHTMDTVMYSLLFSSSIPAETRDEEWHTCSKVHNLFSTPHKHATCHNTPTCYSWQ